MEDPGLEGLLDVCHQHLSPLCVRTCGSLSFWKVMVVEIRSITTAVDADSSNGLLLKLGENELQGLGTPSIGKLYNSSYHKDCLQKEVK